MLFLMIFFISVSFKEGHDLEFFELGFDNSILSDAEDNEKSVAFQAFRIYLNSLGFSFYQFRIICFLIWSVPLFFFIRKFSVYPSLVVATCAMFPIIVFASQMRNGVAIGFVYWGFYFLITRDNILGKILFVALVSLGGLIHNTVFVYLLALLAIRVRPRVDVLFIISASVFVFLMLVIGSGALEVIVSMLFGEYYATFYFSQLEPFVIGNSHNFIGLFINLWFSYRAVTILKAKESLIPDGMLQFSVFVLRFNIVLLSLSPLFLISLSFYRLFQNVFILSVISVMNASHYYKVGYQDKGPQLRLGYLMLYFVITFLYSYGQGTFFEFYNSISL